MTIDLRAIKARAAAATEGPWEIFATPADLAAEVNLEIGPDCAPLVCRVDEGEADAEFIAHAREDIPALLALVDELKDTLATAVETLAAVL